MSCSFFIGKKYDYFFLENDELDFFADNRISIHPLPSSPSSHPHPKLFLKPVLRGHSKIDKTKILMTNGSLMKVESIAECSNWSILQYFWPALNNNLS